MHRIVAPNGSYRPSLFMRVSSSISYLLFATAGLLLVLSHQLLLAYGQTAEVMGWFMLVGGLCSAAGAGSLRWAGEFIGLPLLGTSLVVLGLEIWSHTNADSALLAAGNFALLVAIAGIMVTRWRQVLAVYAVARALGRGRHE